jgi:BirA family biotin operon repressor/biotin-[acetyl-CoA-carboxylase] ligase
MPLRRGTGLEVRIKWPNDLLLKELKIAGILIETATDDAGQMFAVVGIGLNVNHEPEDFPEPIRGSATSLRIASRRLLDRCSLAAEVLRGLAGWYPRLNGDFPAILAEASRRSILLGRTVALQTASERVEGTAEALAEDGRLFCGCQTDGSRPLAQARPRSSRE